MAFGGGVLGNILSTTEDGVIILMAIGGSVSILGVLHELIVIDGAEHGKGFILLSAIRGFISGSVVAPLLYYGLSKMGSELLGSNINLDSLGNGFWFALSLGGAWFSPLLFDITKARLTRRNNKKEEKEDGDNTV
jgi:ABC-type thiamin/hydroxymethylpyrimidine transport system permease subunit